MSYVERARQLRPYLVKAAENLSDKEAYFTPEFFNKWKAGTEYKVAGIRLLYEENGRLYKVKQPHTSQEDWTPDIAASLYEEIPEPGQGDTPENPIPYNNNMALEKDKYYSQFDVVYVCIRDTVYAVYNNLADLVGLYVEVYN